MKQTREEIEAGYDSPDPWGYKTSDADADRKARVLKVCEKYAPVGKFHRALDVACGEAWITQHLPAREIYGYELSAKARTRFPLNVRDASLWPFLFTHQSCDLVVCTGALYGHYDWQAMVAVINGAALTAPQGGSIIVTSHIKAWEVPDLAAALEAIQVFETEFPYRRPEGEYVQKLRVFQK